MLCSSSGSGDVRLYFIAGGKNQLCNAANALLQTSLHRPGRPSTSSTAMAQLHNAASPLRNCCCFSVLAATAALGTPNAHGATACMPSQTRAAKWE
eukprot:4025918-Lingulodinium_polyedra.AAC.1